MRNVAGSSGTEQNDAATCQQIGTQTTRGGSRPVRYELGEEKNIEPQGVIAIMTAPDGYVIATAADFDRSGYGGFKLWDAQRIRTGDAVKRKAVRAYCSDHLANALGSYTIDRMAEDLIQRGKYRITYRAIGWDEEVQDALERR